MKFKERILTAVLSLALCLSGGTAVWAGNGDSGSAADANADLKTFTEDFENIPAEKRYYSGSEFGQYLYGDTQEALEGGAYSKKGEAQTLFESANGFKWVLSGVWVGAVDYSKPGNAGLFLPSDDDPENSAYGNSCLVWDRWAWRTDVNLDMGKNQYNSIAEVSADARSARNDMGASLRFMVSEDELSFYEIGFGRAADKPYPGCQEAVPYFAKVKNKTAEKLEMNATEKVTHAGKYVRLRAAVQGDTISYSIVNCADNTVYVEGTYQDTEVDTYAANTRFPIALTTQGDMFTAFDNVKVTSDYTNPDLPYYGDDFSSYSAVPLRRAIPGVAQRIAGSAQGTWYQSGVWVGYVPTALDRDPNGTGANAIHPGAVSVSEGALKVQDAYQKMTTANLKLSKPLYDVDKITCTTQAEGDVRSGFRFLISEDERSFYEVGISKSYSDDVTAPYFKSAPFFRKVKDGNQVAVVSGAAAENNPYSELRKPAVKWTVDLEGNEIRISASVAGVEVPWSYTFQDTDLSEMMGESAYPAAAFASGDGTMKFDNLEIFGTPVKPVVQEKSDEVTVSYQPKCYTIPIGHTVSAVLTDDTGTVLAQQNVADAADPQELTFSKPSAGYQATLWDNTANTRLTPSGWYQSSVYTLQDTIPETRTVVACVGDSLTEGQGAIAGMSGLANQYIWAYPNQLQRMLGGDYDVKGFGVGGRCVLSTGTYPYVNEDAFTLSKQCNPDIVIVMLGTNDIGALINDESKQETFCQEYKALVQSYQNTDKQPVIYLVVPPLKRSDLGSAANSKIAAFMQPAILQVAKELGCRAVALNTLVAEEDFTPRDDLMKDDTHYTTFGYQEFAKVLSDAIKGQDSSLTLDDTTEGKCVVSARTPLEASVFTAAHKNDFLQELKPLTINGRMPVGRFALEPEADADRWQVLAWKSMGSLEPMEGITAKRDGSGIKTEGAEAKVYGTVKPGKIVDVAVKNAEGTAILLKSQAANNAGYYEVNLGSAYQNGCKVYVNGVAQN